MPLENKNKIEQTENETQSVVAVCLGTGGIAAGGDKVFKNLKMKLKIKFGCCHRKTCLQDSQNWLQRFVREGCSGRCNYPWTGNLNL